jgi:hypothetical protein
MTTEESDLILSARIHTVINIILTLSLLYNFYFIYQQQEDVGENPVAERKALLNAVAERFDNNQAPGAVDMLFVGKTLGIYCRSKHTTEQCIDQIL